MKFTTFSISFYFLFLISCSTPEKIDYPSIIINNVNLIDAKNGLIESQSIAISDSRIIGVGKNISSSETTQIIDGSGKYLIPGLWDTHVHMTFDPDVENSMFRLFLANGITSIRDTGGELDKVLKWKQKADSKLESSPRLMVAGPLLDGIPTVYDGSSPMRPKLGLGAGTPEEATLLVDKFVEMGVDLIKSYEMLTPEAFEAVIARSKFHKKVVTGHVPLSMDVIDASNLGLRSMEHMRNLEMSCSTDYDSLLKVRKKMLFDGKEKSGGELRSSIHSAQRYYAVNTQDDERRNLVLQTLAKNNTWQIPTMMIVSSSTNRSLISKEWIDNFKFMSDSARIRWTKLAEQLKDSPVNPDAIAYTDWAVDMVNRLNKAGVGIMAGTDCPIFLLTPGFSLHQELEWLVKGGLSPLEALNAATLRPAQYFDLQDDLGTIEIGKIADLILLDENPLENISNTQKINAVIRNGKLYSREALDKMLNNVN